MVQLNDPAAEVLRALMLQLGIGSDIVAPGSDQPSWPFYHSMMTSSPDNQLAIYDTSPIIQNRSQWKETQELFGIQFRIRSQGFDDGWDMGEEIKHCLDNQILRNTLIFNESTYLIQSVIRSGGLLSLGAEQPTVNRRLFSLNAVMCMNLVSNL